jgi:[acyl-carrier-protein] S-malonyltransferase
MAVSMAILRSLEFECGLSFEKLCGFTAGHSLGEYTALCASESLTLGAAAELLRIRGEAFREVGMASHGSMAVFGAPLNLVEEIVGESVMAGEVLEITNDNTDDQVVLSGSENSVDRALELARSKGISRVKKLSVSGAFHSKLMEPAVDIMRGALESVKIGRPVVGVMANYSAEPENADEIRGNLLRQITNRVRWRETMLNLEKLGVDRFIEIGPGRVLTNMVRKTCPKATALSISSPEGMREFLGTL